MTPGEQEDTATGLSLAKEVDAIRDRFAQALRSGTSPRIEAFLAEAVAAARPTLFRELLRIEFVHRHGAGERPTADEYLLRFPEYGALIESSLRQLVTIPNTAVRQTAWPPPGQPSLRPGDRIDEFEIKQELGRGAFGSVYLAWQHGVDRDVALKVTPLRSDEPRHLALLDGHPNIVRIHDQRRCAERGLHLVYMEYVPGVTLRSVVEQSRESPAGPQRDRARRELVWRIGPQLADALDFAHRREVLHCDVKPANVVLDANGNPKLVDFNIAHRTSLERATVGGTLAYMSPEQLDAYRETDEKEQRRKVGQLDGRSDIYSLGIVLWELLTGAPPFEDAPDGEDTVASLTVMAQRRLAGLPPRGPGPSTDDVPEGLRRVLLRCLAPDPGARYACAGELARELRLSAREDVQGLLYPPRAGWRELILSWPLACLILLGVLCNLVPGAVCISYNRKLLEGAGELARAEQFFFQLVLVINAVAFGVAILICAALGWPMLRALHALRAAAPAERLPDAVARCHVIGHHVALVTIAVGAAASLAWGVLMWSQLDWHYSKTLHFAGSVFVSVVMIAAPLAFFSITFTCARVLLPRLVREARAWPPIDLEPYIRLYLGVLLFGPFVAIGLFALVNKDLGSSNHLLIVLAALSAAGAWVGQTCSRAIRADLQVLSQLD
jgi:serine/threonine protein kinase